VSERDAEIPWAVANTVAPVLDVGCAESTYLADLPAPVDGIDVRAEGIKTVLRQFFWGDVRTFEFPGFYRTVLAISTLEHVGLECGQYGTKADDPDGDRHALAACYAVLGPGGKVLVSVPFGRPADHGWFRQYDLAGLHALLAGYDADIEIRVGPHWDTPADLADIDVDYDHRRGSAGAVALVTVRKN
jgi:SAM-dependent methyltransferase